MRPNSVDERKAGAKEMSVFVYNLARCIKAGQGLHMPVMLLPLLALSLLPSTLAFFPELDLDTTAFLDSRRHNMPKKNNFDKPVIPYPRIGKREFGRSKKGMEDRAGSQPSLVDVKRRSVYAGKLWT